MACTRFGRVDRTFRVSPVDPCSPLWEYCEYDHTGNFQQALSAGASPYIIDNLGNTLLEQAIAFGAPRMVVLLLQLGLPRPPPEPFYALISRSRWAGELSDRLHDSVILERQHAAPDVVKGMAIICSHCEVCYDSFQISESDEMTLYYLIWGCSLGYVSENYMHYIRVDEYRTNSCYGGIGSSQNSLRALAEKISLPPAYLVIVVRSVLRFIDGHESGLREALSKVRREERALFEMRNLKISSTYLENSAMNRSLLQLQLLRCNCSPHRFDIHCEGYC